MKTPALALLLILTLAALTPLSCTSAEDRFNQGNELFEARQYDEAIQAYTEAINLDSEHASAYYGRGKSHLESENFDSAESDFQRALRLNPDLANATRVDSEPRHLVFYSIGELIDQWNKKTGAFEDEFLRMEIRTTGIVKTVSSEFFMG